MIQFTKEKSKMTKSFKILFQLGMVMEKSNLKVEHHIQDIEKIINKKYIKN